MLGRSHRTQGLHRRTLVRRNLSPKQVRNRDRSDDQNDGDNNQEFNQGKPPLSILRLIQVVVFFPTIFVGTAGPLRGRGEEADASSLPGLKALLERRLARRRARVQDLADCRRRVNANHTRLIDAIRCRSG